MKRILMSGIACMLLLGTVSAECSPCALSKLRFWNPLIAEAKVFKKCNKDLPGDKKYHSFLLDKDLNVILVGSPIDNDNLKSIYNKCLGIN